MKRGYMAKSPAEEIDNMPKETRRTVRPLSRPDVDRLMAEAGPWYAPLLFLAATTGLRQSELFGLQWDAVDLDGRTVEVRRQLYKGQLKDDLKTEAARRTVELSPEAVAHAKGREGAPSQVALCVHRGARRADQWRQLLASVAQVGGRGPLAQRHHDPSSTPHTYASILIHEGCSAKTVQYRMGHSKVQTTLDLYGHLWPEDAEKARNAVDRWASGALTGHSKRNSERPERAKRIV